MAKNLEISYVLDFYGDVLTDKQREAMEEYARRFGPLTMDLIDETDCHSWEWMMQPWPWERSGKGRC